MGRGKKKGDKKQEQTPASLSSSEQPSTSQEAPAPAEESAEMAGDGKRKDKKASSEPSVISTTKKSEPTAAAPAVPEGESLETEFEGLGLSGGKKKSRRSKKKDNVQAEKTLEKTTPAVQVPVSSSAGPSQEMSASGRPGPPHPFPEKVPSGPSQQYQPAQPQQYQPGPRQQYQPGPRQQHQPGPRQQYQPGPPQQYQPGPPQQYRPGPPQQAVPQPGGTTGMAWGRGRGSIQPPQAVQPGGTTVQQYPSHSGITMQQLPEVKAQSTTTLQKQPSAAKTQQQQRPQQFSGSAVLTNIPAKIIGNTVRFIPIKVLTNYLPMTIKPLKIYRYDVSFKPDRPKKALPKAYMMVKNQYYPNEVMAFDQVKNCYCLKSLPNVPVNDRFTTNVEVKDDNGRVMKFEVSFKATGVVDLKTINDYMEQGGSSLNPPTEAIQCIDVVLRQGTLEAYVKCGRQFFSRPSKPLILGDGLEMWTGLFQSAIFTSRPFVNVDVVHKGFPIYQPLMNVFMEFRLDPSRSLENQRGFFAETFISFVKGLKVEACIGGATGKDAVKRVYICNDIKESCNKCTFPFTDASGKERTMTVYDYFTKEKKCQLRYPNLNCLWVGPRDKSIYYPIELLDVAYGQIRNKQLNEKQLSTMVRVAASPPDERKTKIEDIVKKINYSQNPIFKKFGLEISHQFFPVEAKVLEPPRLDVGDGRPVQPRAGVWRADKFVKAEALESWGFIAIEVDPRSNCDFDGIIDMVMKSGRMCGMRVTEPTLRIFDVNMRNLNKVLFTALEKGVRFLFVIVSQRGRDYYHRVKRSAECEVGILTQCIKEQTASRRMNMQTVKNILLKVNSKLMGVNQTLSNTSTPRCLVGGGVMVVGADVTHPSPDQVSVPSIAAVTASIDQKCFIYNLEMSVQTPKMEMIVEFEDIMLQHLKVYRNEQKSLPKKIYVFRDGVSEGQFAQVMHSELRAVYNAYATLAGDKFKPEVLFLLVQKRHHTRLFQNAPKPGNVEPGTVVDTHIVHARELDFYLVSHQAIKGTARPTRYHAVCNTGNIPHDEVEQLTYYLCHLFSRCMRAVSYPTPTYYAHLACMRARSLTYFDKFDNKQLESQPKRLDVNKILQFSRMFFV